MNIIRDKTDRYPSDHFPKVVDYLWIILKYSRIW